MYQGSRGRRLCRFLVIQRNGVFSYDGFPEDEDKDEIEDDHEEENEDDHEEENEDGKPGLDIYDCPVKARVRLLCRLLLKTAVAATAEK